MTDSERRGLARLLLRRPEWRDVPPKLAAKESVVRQLCSAYESQWTNLERMAGPEKAEAAMAVLSLGWLTSEIEDDLDLWLQASSDRRFAG